MSIFYFIMQFPFDIRFFYKTSNAYVFVPLPNNITMPLVINQPLNCILYIGILFPNVKYAVVKDHIATILYSCFIQELYKDNLPDSADSLCTVSKSYVRISTFCIITGFPVCLYNCTTELLSP